jgi:alanyl-tRNA synthetase
MTADILREKFLSFFKAKNHKIVDSDSLVPKDDPTVLFTPAGMNQFKREFLGFDAGFKRAATSQRCLRTDDLDKVGKTSSHHTFFEMLGNFSFGDYFKSDAIAWAWEFLTKELRIDPAKLWVSVYQDDSEAYNIWKDEIHIPVNRIVKLGDKDNFWPAEAKAKGPNGPCGPCSEIFYDFGESIGCGEKICNPACSCGRFVEIWNLVFTQFNRKEDGTLEPLPNKNIDTGMGLERLSAIMQGKRNNFETELFQPVIKEIQRAGTSALPVSKQGRNRVETGTQVEYAVADHLRAVVFSIYDGITPSNEGRGYIVRKIIRKSVMHLRSLGIDKPFLYKLTGQLAEIMRKPYPDLMERANDIAQVILNEENNFIDILNSSEALLARIPLNGFAEEIGAIVFKLYDTHGLPSELIEEYLKEQGVKDLAAIAKVVDAKFEEQRQRSKSQSKMKGDVFDAKGLGIKLNPTKFIGYAKSSAQANILAILNDAKEVDQSRLGESLQIVLEQTPFYAESGGQTGDTGKLSNGENVFEVLNTQKIDNVFLHIGKVISGSFKKGDQVFAQINTQRRLNIAKNHTATHLLQAALRQVLGNHVQQQGSMVAEEKLRFDFTHFKRLTVEEITKIEDLANSFIAGNQAVNCKEMPLKEAKQAGALAFFEEKYGDHVRVVSIGGISKELCGGTHIDDIGKIGLIKIISDSSVASGIRRIEAVTGSFAEQFIKQKEQG